MHTTLGKGLSLREQGTGATGPRQGNCLPPNVCHMAQAPARQHAKPVRRFKAASGSEAGGWGEARPEWLDTCLDLVAPGAMTDLNVEWQAFVAGSGRRQHPQPLIWNGDGRQSELPSGDSSSSVSSSGDDDAAPSTSNRGPEASCSGRYASSIQSFDDWDFEEDLSVPAPCNLPVNEASIHNAGAGPSLASITSSGSMPNREQHPWAAAVGQQPSRHNASPADMLTCRSLWHSLREVYVLLFGVGQKDTEGIYSLRAVSDDGLPTETIIAFENMDDAVRYAALLEATMEHCPHVCSIPPTELMAFCSDSGYRCRVELEGSLLMPPDYNVYITDWERSLRLREGKFHVLPEEPDYSQQEYPAGSALQPAVAGMQESSSSGQLLLRQSDLSAAQFTAAQLDYLKAQLEALLPDTPQTSSDE